jgi:hypothetical protein
MRRPHAMLCTFRIPDPHVEFLRECYPAEDTFTGAVRQLLRRRAPAAKRPREIRGGVGRQAVRLGERDAALLESLRARLRERTPGAALVREVERRAHLAGYVLVPERGRRIWG